MNYPTTMQSPLLNRHKPAPRREISKSLLEFHYYFRAVLECGEAFDLARCQNAQAFHERPRARHQLQADSYPEQRYCRFTG